MKNKGIENKSESDYKYGKTTETLRTLRMEFTNQSILILQTQ
jgi:hypothetical protein